MLLLTFSYILRSSELVIRPWMLPLTTVSNHSTLTSRMEEAFYPDTQTPPGTIRQLCPPKLCVDNDHVIMDCTSLYTILYLDRE